MLKSRFKLFLLAIVIAATGAMSLSSCSNDDENNPSNPSAQEFAYKSFAIGNEGSQQIVLDKLTGSIRSIESSATWLTATDAGQSASGCPIILLQNKDGQNGEATVTVTAENGDKAIVTVTHQSLSDGDDGANSDFITNWWNYDVIQLEGISNAQKAPWTVEGGVQIPDEVRLQFRPEDGWEMAFSYTNDNSLKGVRIFALYNKWTGQLRVYSYIDRPTGWGNEILFRTYFGDAFDNCLYPFYHSLHYAIPSNHVPGKNLLRNAQLVDKQPQTFMAWVSPYMQSESLQNGWYVFEVDMSGYVPEGQDWVKSGHSARLKIFADTKQDQSVTLRGSLIGGIKGEFDNPQYIQHGGTSALYGISNALDMISGMSSNSISSCFQYASLMKNGGDEGLGAYLNPAKYWGGFACSIGSALFGFLANQADPITTEYIPGKIDLNLDATIELSGHITSTTSNDFSPLAVSESAILAANGPDGHMGKGVWGLAEDPVVYIDKDVILSNIDRINFVNRGNNTYSHTEFEPYALRTVWFLDPASVKVNLNPELFPDVKEVSITTTCGVYPTRAYGNTDAYRRMLMLEDRPVVDISTGKGVGKLVRLNTTSTPRLVVVRPEDLLATGSNEYETAANSRFFTQSVANTGDLNMHFYGHMVHEMGQDIMVEPQAYLPYTQKDGTYYFNGPTAPDLVVTVQAVFESQGSTFHYSKLFIPRIEVVDHNTIKAKYQNLKDFANKCRNTQTTGTLANQPGVKVYNPDGHRLLEKTLRLLEKIQ